MPSISSGATVIAQACDGGSWVLPPLAVAWVSLAAPSAPIYAGPCGRIDDPKKALLVWPRTTSLEVLSRHKCGRVEDDLPLGAERHTVIEAPPVHLGKLANSLLFAPSFGIVEHNGKLWRKMVGKDLQRGPARVMLFCSRWTVYQNHIKLALAQRGKIGVCRDINATDIAACQE
jgi:hypothetical protein